MSLNDNKWQGVPTANLRSVRKARERAVNGVTSQDWSFPSLEHFPPLEPSPPSE